MKRFLLLLLSFSVLMCFTGFSYGAVNQTFKSKNDILGVWVLSGQGGDVEALEITAKKVTVYNRKAGSTDFEKIASTDFKNIELSKDKKRLSIWIYEDSGHYFKKDSKGNIKIAVGYGNDNEMRYNSAKKYKTLKEASNALAKDKNVAALIEKKPVIERVENAEYTLYTETEFTMPTHMEIVLSNGDKLYEPVAWDSYPSMFDKPTTLEIQGVVKKFNAKISFKLNVIDKYVSTGNPAFDAMLARQTNTDKPLASSLAAVSNMYVAPEHGITSLAGLDKFVGIKQLSICETPLNSPGAQPNINYDLNILKYIPNLDSLFYGTSSEARVKELVNLTKEMHLKKLTISYRGICLTSADIFKDVKADALEISSLIEDYSYLPELAKVTDLSWDYMNEPASNDEYIKTARKRAIADQRIADREASLNQFVDSLIDNNNLRSLSVDMQIKFVHDYIVNNTSYDFDNFKNGSIPSESYTAYGVFINHAGVCSGYADAFKLVMDKLGIDCYVLSGEAYSFGSWGGHAWNVVKTSQGYRLIDVTWDDPIYQTANGREEVLRYDYYLLTDEEMDAKSNHKARDRASAPECK